jgi:probable rRNA maturation factor
MAGGYPVVFCCLQGRLGAYANSLMDHAVNRLGRTACLLKLGEEHELSLLLCDNPFIRRLNRRWRDRDVSTDVLSFPMHVLKPGDVPPAGPLGDIVVSLPSARLAAREEGVSDRGHLSFLIIHGLLHLVGYDHQTRQAHRVMKNMEDHLMKHLS